METLTRPAETPTSQPSAAHAKRRWRTRTKVLVGAGAVVVLGGAPIVVDLALDGSHHTTRQFTGKINTLDIDMSSGSLTVVGTNDSVVVVDVTTHGGLRKASHSETLVGDHLRLRSACGLDLLTPSCGADFVVHVPEHVSIVAIGDGTNIDVLGTSGDVDLSINGGHVDLQFGSAPNSVKANLNGGNVMVEVPNDETAYRVEADTNGGSTHVDVRTDPSSAHRIDVRSNGGNVDVRYPTDEQ
jgi:Putative adhesin